MALSSVCMNHEIEINFLIHTNASEKLLRNRRTKSNQVWEEFYAKEAMVNHE
jgi:hypothetical protein